MRYGEPIVKIRDIVLDTMVKLGNRDFNFIFTNALYEGRQEDLEVYNSLLQAVQKCEGCFIPVRVICSEDEHRRRIVAPEREINMKDTNHAKVAELYQAYQPFNPPHANSVTIDVTHLTAAEAADTILKQTKEIYLAWQNNPKMRGNGPSLG